MDYIQNNSSKTSGYRKSIRGKIFKDILDLYKIFFYGGNKHDEFFRIWQR